MLAGELYDPMDAELVAARTRARDLCQALNATREAEREERRAILRELFARGGESVWMQPPFFCDYGSNIELGERVFFNYNCVVLDVCRVRIGDFTLFGPAVQILTLHGPERELRMMGEAGFFDISHFGDRLTLAEATDRKASVSHRGQAFRTLRAFLNSSS